jgi:hypothetical protein
VSYLALFFETGANNGAYVVFFDVKIKSKPGSRLREPISQPPATLSMKGRG